MSYVPKKKKSNYKPKYKSNKYKSNRNSKIPKTIGSRYTTSPSQCQYAKLNWVGTKEWVSTATTTPYAITLVPNNLYDISPDLPGIQQPLYRDQMFALYAAARVVGFKIDIECIATTSLPTDMCLAPLDIGLDTDINVTKQRKYAKYAVQNINQRSYMKLSQNTDNYFGRKRGYTLMDDTSKQIAGGDTMSSANRCEYQLLVRDILGTIPATSKFAIMTIKITQYVRFEEPLQVSFS